MPKQRTRPNLNIGIVIFGAIFIYLLITLVLFITHRHVETYQVITGPLSGNETCTALILRDEDVVMSRTAGYVNHFISNGSKVGKNQTVCAVTSTLVPNEYKTLKPSDYASLRSLLSKASRSFTNVRFENTNDLKFDILGALWNRDTLSTSSGNYYNATGDGYIAYSSDGKEYMTVEELDPDMFQTSVYSLPKITNQSVIQSGDAIYRIIYGETWSIYFPITDKQLVRLAQKPNLQVRFLKDGAVESGTMTFFMIEEQRYARITFDSGLYRYIDDRYEDIELITNNQEGLKIPVSSIVKKEFFAVPADFVSLTGGEEAGFYKEVRYEDGSKSNEFVETILYAKVTDKTTGGEEYYVEKSSFNEGDILVSPDSDDKYTIGKTGMLEGVYCVNKGYSVFRKISIIDQNEEYCIVEPNTSYGIAQFDYIVKKGNSVKESDVIY